MAHALGTVVKQVVPVIQGSIADVRYEPSEQTFTYLVDFTDADGNHQSRWFEEAQIEVVPAAV